MTPATTRRRSKRRWPRRIIKKLRAEQAEARKQGKLMGIGICTYGEICGLGRRRRRPAGGWESATVKIEPSGKVTVLTGTCSHGQGEETTFAQIAADELGVDIDDILVLRGDTAIVPYGIGTFGSRGYGDRRDGALFCPPGSERENEEIRCDAARIG